MKQYQVPVIEKVNGLSIQAFAQSGELTALVECNTTSDCQQQVGEDTFHLNFCAEGISDPSDLNGSAYQINYSNCDDVAHTLSNCTTTQNISCGDESIAVSCEYTDDCGLQINCQFISVGILSDGNFEACPELPA